MRMMMMSYRPTRVDIEWAREQLRRLKQGGTMAFPATRLVYHVDHINRKVVLINPDQARSPESRTVHERTIATFAAVGYDVIEQRGQTDFGFTGTHNLSLDDRDPRKR